MLNIREMCREMKKLKYSQNSNEQCTVTPIVVNSFWFLSVWLIWIWLFLLSCGGVRGEQWGVRASAQLSGLGRWRQELHVTRFHRSETSSGQPPAEQWAVQHQWWSDVPPAESSDRLQQHYQHPRAAALISDFTQLGEFSPTHLVICHYQRSLKFIAHNTFNTLHYCMWSVVCIVLN